MKKLRKVEVVWIDPTSEGGWILPDVAEQAQPAVCVNIGYLLTRDRKVIRIVSGYASNDSVSDVFTIPAACVRGVRFLR
jgi:hypothetical protein